MISPQEIRTVTFDKVMRGYRPEDVDALLQQLAQQMEQIFRQADAQASAQLTPQELRQLTAMLKTVCASLAPTGRGEV